MSIQIVTAEQFAEFINVNNIVFVDFWAAWCAPCLQFAKTYEKVAEQNPNLIFAKVNIEEEHELADSLQIRSIPHLMIFKQGILIYSEAGSMPESMLNDLVKQSIAADVSEIRAKIDEEEANNKSD